MIGPSLEQIIKKRLLRGLQPPIDLNKPLTYAQEQDIRIKIIDEGKDNPDKKTKTLEKANTGAPDAETKEISTKKSKGKKPVAKKGESKEDSKIPKTKPKSPFATRDKENDEDVPADLDQSEFKDADAASKGDKFSTPTKSVASSIQVKGAPDGSLAPLKVVPKADIDNPNEISFGGITPVDIRPTFATNASPSDKDDTRPVRESRDIRWTRKMTREKLTTGGMTPKTEKERAEIAHRNAKSRMRDADPHLHDKMAKVLTNHGWNEQESNRHADFNRANSVHFSKWQHPDHKGHTISIAGAGWGHLGDKGIVNSDLAKPGEDRSNKHKSLETHLKKFHALKEENLNEISKGLARRYYNKASKEINARNRSVVGTGVLAGKGSIKPKVIGIDRLKKHTDAVRKLKNREEGMDRAHNRLKSFTNEAEINELSKEFKKKYADKAEQSVGNLRKSSKIEGERGSTHFTMGRFKQAVDSMKKSDKFANKAKQRKGIVRKVRNENYFTGGAPTKDVSGSMDKIVEQYQPLYNDDLNNNNTVSGNVNFLAARKKRAPTPNNKLKPPQPKGKKFQTEELNEKWKSDAELENKTIYHGRMRDKAKGMADDFRKTSIKHGESNPKLSKQTRKMSNVLYRRSKRHGTAHDISVKMRQERKGIKVKEELALNAVRGALFRLEEDTFHEPLTLSINGYDFYFDVAQTPKEREEGLMFTESIPLNYGMLFDFGEEEVVNMWMEDTVIPLDMIFIDEEGVIQHIETDCMTESEDLISSEVPVRYVLEINAGLCEDLEIEVGDIIESKVLSFLRVWHPAQGR